VKAERITMHESGHTLSGARYCILQDLVFIAGTSLLHQAFGLTVLKVELGNNGRSPGLA